MPRVIGFWSALLTTVAGAAYALVILYLMVTGQFTLPLPASVELFAALVTIASAPLIVASMAAVHCLVHESRRVLTLLGVVFASVFMVMVSINRFVQLAVVRPSLLRGDTAGLERFMPYEPGSAMLALELVGWGFFLGLAMLSVAFSFARTGLGGLIRWTCLVYAALGLGSAVAFVADSPLSAVGFVAWGLVLPVATALLAVWFRPAQRSARPPVAERI